MALVKLSQELQDVDDGWRVVLAQATEYRLVSRHQECWDLAVMGLAICPAYARTQFYFEVGVVAFYLKLFKEGLEAIDKVLTDPNTTPSNYQCSIRNLEFYIQTIDGKHSTTNIRDYYPYLSPQWYGSSISYVQNTRKLTSCYRVVNYQVVEGKYVVNDISYGAPGVVYTRNFLVEGNAAWDTKVRELICPEWMIPYPSQVRGLEDVRLFGKNKFTCTSRCHNKKSVAKVCYGEYGTNGVIAILHPIVYQNEDVHEKNMLPFMVDHEPYILNFCNDYLLVMKIIIGEEQLELVHTVKVPHCNKLRGSAGPVPYRNGWLFTIHEGNYEGSRKYYHRLMWLSDDFTTVKHGKIFSFTNTPIEFNIGIYIDRNTDEIVLGYSVNDGSTHEVRITSDNPWMPEVEVPQPVASSSTAP